MGITTDSNAQENVGRQIQHNVGYNKLTIGQMIENCWLFVGNFQQKRGKRKEGVEMFYGENKKKRKDHPRRNKNKKFTSRDSGHRPPDNGKQLLGRKKKINSGAEPFRGIPWSFHITDKEYATNTCAIDSVLTVLFDLERNGMLGANRSLLDGLKQDSLMRKSFRYMETGDYSMARWVLNDLRICNMREETMTAQPIDLNNWWMDISMTCCDFKWIL